MTQIQERNLIESKPSRNRKNKPNQDLAADRVPRWLIYLPLGVYLIFTLIPFYWILLFSTRKTGSTTLLPTDLTMEHFSDVWSSGFAGYFANSLLVSTAVMIFVTIFALLGGYALARYEFRGKAVFMALMLCTQFVPGAMMLIPLYNIFRYVGLINTLWSVVVADTVFQLSLSIILMSGFVRNTPVELEEAAWLDGCNRFTGFIRIVMPMLAPGSIAVSSFAFIGAWNNFLFALMFLVNQNRFTVPVGLSYMMGEDSVDFGALAAGGVLAVVPVVLLFAYVQRFLVKGMNSGAVKG